MAGLHVEHDANVALAEDGEVHVVLEPERLFNRRCAIVCHSRFNSQWPYTLTIIHHLYEDTHDMWL